MKPQLLQVARSSLRDRFDYYWAIADALSSDYEVTTVFLNGTLSQSEIDRYPGQVIFFDCDSWLIQRSWNIAWKLFKLQRRNHYSVVISHHYKATAAVNLLRKFSSIPKAFSVIHHFGHYSKPKRQRFVRSSLKKDTQFICVSKALSKELHHDNPSLKVNRVNVIYNAINEAHLQNNLFSKNESRQLLDIPSSQFVIGSVGRLVPEKSYEDLIHAMVTLSQKFPSLHCIIAGDGHLYASLQSLIQNLNLSERITMLGDLPNASRYMSAFDIFVLPSRAEAFGLVLLEAMINRLPIVASNIGGIPEVMGDYDYLVQPSDPSLLANTIEKMMQLTENERTEIINSQYSHAIEHFSLDKMQSSYKALLSRL